MADSNYPTQDPDLQSQLMEADNAASIAANASIQTQGEQATQLAVAQQNYQTQTAVAVLTSGATTYAAQQQLAATQYEVDHQDIRDPEIANIEAANRLAVAQVNYQGTVYDADQQLTGQKYDADQRLAGTQFTATTDASVRNLGNQLDYQARNYATQTNFNASVYGSDQDLTGRKYAADQGLAGDVYQANQQLAGVNAAQAGEDARLVAKLAYADGKFNLVYPFVQQSLEAAQNDNTTIATPNLSFQAPVINANGVFTAGQVQAQVNSALARCDSRTQSQIRQMQGDLAGRGFSSNSPLADMLTVGLTGQNLRAGVDAEREIRFEAAKANSDAIFQVNQLQQQQFNQNQQAALDSERNQVTRQVGLVGGLAQLIGGLT